MLAQAVVNYQVTVWDKNKWKYHVQQTYCVYVRYTSTEKPQKLGPTAVTPTAVTPTAVTSTAVTPTAMTQCPISQNSIMTTRQY